MNTFLCKIAQLDSVHDVLLLSVRGEVLFCSLQDDPEIIEQKITNWNDIIASLGRPLATDFLFENGRYVLCFTDAGYVIVGMHDDKHLEEIKSKSVKIRTKLSDQHFRRKALLEMLSEVDDRLKPQLVKEVVALANDEVADALVSLLQKESEFLPDIKEKLLLFICQALGRCSSSSAVQPLKEFLQSYDPGKISFNCDIEKVALNSISELEKIKPAKTKKNTTKKAKKKTKEKSTKDSSTPGPPEPKSDTELPGQKRIKDLLAKNKKGEAVALLIQLIEKTACAKQFEVAEKLREWLIDIDPMSLMEIIHAAEIIEEEKRASIDSVFLSTWKNLAEVLTSEEFSALYHALIFKTYSEGETVVSQGQFLPALFLVNSGSVQLFAVAEESIVPLKALEQGEIMGAGTFFDCSVWTVHAKSMGGDLARLPHERLQPLKEEFPGIESKLYDYCSQYQSHNAIFRKSNRNRRMFERIKASGRTAVVLLDKNGKATGVGAKGELFDVSLGGLACSLRISQKKNAMMLFGKKIRVSIPLGNNRKEPLLRHGLVMAVRSHHLTQNEYSVHIMLDEQLKEQEIQLIIGAGQTA